MRLLPLFALIALAASDPSKPTAPRARSDAPDGVQEALDRSIVLKAEMVKSLPEAITQAKADLVNRKTGRIVAGQNSRGRAGYVFPDKDAKAKSIADAQGTIDALADTLAKAKDPKTIRIDWLREKDLHVGGIGKIRHAKVTQVVGDTQMLVAVNPADTGSGDGYLLGTKDFFIDGASTKDLEDGAEITSSTITFRITGTYRYQTAIGGTRTVLKLEPFKIRDWVK